MDTRRQLWKVLSTVIALLIVDGCAAPREGVTSGIGTQRPGDVLTVADALGELHKTLPLRSGWFVPKEMLTLELKQPNAGKRGHRSVVAILETDTRFTAREVGRVKLILPRWMGQAEAMTILPRPAPWQKLAQELALNDPVDTDIASFTSFIATVTPISISSRNPGGSFLKQTWYVKLPNVPIGEVLRLIGAASRAKITVEGHRVVLDGKTANE